MSKRQCCGYNTYKRLVCNLWMELPCAFLYLFGVISVSRGGGKLGEESYASDGSCFYRLSSM